MFDTDSFLQTSVDSELSTVSEPIPTGEYQAVVKSVAARSGEKDGNGWLILDVTWDIDSPEVAAVTGRDVNTCRQSVFVDVTENGGLDVSKGRNVQLGRLRKAVNQNGPGPWAPSMLEGQVARIRVDHRMYEGNVYADVKGVTKL